jgi:uncharacterized membrane protein
MDNFIPSDNGRTAGIISYLTIIGWLIAYFGFHQKDRSELGSYQLRQTLLFHIISIVLNGLSGFIIGILFYSPLGLAENLLWIIRLTLFVFWVIGFIGAAKGQKRPIPLIGERAQTTFPGI